MTATKTVAVLCFRCGYEFRRHQTEMRPDYQNNAPCPKCQRRTVVHRSPEKKKGSYQICPDCDGWASITGSCDRCGRSGMVQGGRKKIVKTKTDPGLTKEQKEMIEEFQCPGCVAGMNVKCGAFKLHAEYGFTCMGHVPGTTKMPGGTFCLGLPKGFDKVGDAREKMTKEPYIRLWEKGTAPDWDKLNVAVWAQEKDGYLFVRTFSPRINKTYIDVIAGGTMKMVPGAIDVADFKGEID